MLIAGLLLKWAPNLERMIVVLSWIVVAITWCVSSWMSWRKWRAERYEVDQDSINVYQKNGKFGQSKAIYRYESIISARMVQGYWGKKYNYGDIYLTIPKLDREIVLRDVENPDQPMAKVQQVVSSQASGKSNALIT